MFIKWVNKNLDSGLYSSIRGAARPCAYTGAPDNGMWIPERGLGDTDGILGDTDGISVTDCSCRVVSS